ncbi:hypothetical protein CFC21_104819 [Triticum aestivum]|uniref:Uncharacterized protein n=1 Tax=Triticum aestivum TaxID=4565 RepID=A0A9R1N7X9_WHEAT|nr:hypothetical protein CFC21_104819 [Triticum aestivum]
MDHLIMDDVLATPITTQSSCCGIAPQLTINAIVPPTAPTLRRLAVDDAVTASSTTTSCRMQRPCLHVDDAFAAPIATPSSPHNGLVPSYLPSASHRRLVAASHRHHLAASHRNRPPAASRRRRPPTSCRRPPPHMESAASSSPPSLPRIDKALMPIVGAASSQRRSSSSTSSCLAQLSLLSSMVSLKNT